MFNMHEVHLKFRTPGGRYCNCETYKPGERSTETCRFCKEIKHRNKATQYQCLLFAQNLDTHCGLVVKCYACQTERNNHSVIEYEDSEADANPQFSLKKLVSILKKEIKTHNKRTLKFIDAGMPVDVAQDMSLDEIIERWQ